MVRPNGGEREWMTDPAPEEDSRRRDATEMLQSSLDEAGYLIDRARRLATRNSHGDRRSPLAKPSQRGRPG